MKKILLIIFSFMLLNITLAYILFTTPAPSKETKEKTHSEQIEKEDYIVPSKYKDIKIKTRSEASGDERYLLHVSWPVTENEDINKKLDIFAESFIEEYNKTAAEIEKSRQDYIAKTGQDGATFHTNYNLHFDVAFANDDYVAFVFINYRSTGNTGNDQVTSKIFSRKNGEEIPTPNLFIDKNYLATLSDLSRQDLYQRVESEAKDSDFASEKLKDDWIKDFKKNMVDEGTKPTPENFKNIVITDEGDFTIYFDKYQVAPGTWGVVKVIIPLEKIKNLLIPEVRDIFNLSVPEASVSSNKNTTSSNTIPKKPSTLSEKNENAANNINCSILKCIALTFDDGPSIYTEELLKTLISKSAVATFFVLGSNAKIQQQTIIDLKNAGMEIANHTWDHKDLSKLTLDEAQAEIINTNTLLTKITNLNHFSLRPPYGSITGPIKNSIPNPIVLWNIDTEDWKYRDSEYLKKYVQDNAKNGAIILMHDIHKTTVDAVGDIIDSLQSSGYTLVTVDQLFNKELATGRVYSSLF